MTRVFSLDHKVIGIQYAITSMVFLLIGFTLMMLMRWQLASQLCGLRHYRMRGVMRVVSPEEFRVWMGNLITDRESRVA